MNSVTQVEEHMQRILGPVADQLAKQTGFVQRERQVSGSSFAQGLIFGWLHRPEARLTQLAQGLGRARCPISASGLSQRFDEKAISFLQALYQELMSLCLQVEPTDVAVLRRFSAVIVEDSSQISLPASLLDRFRGCGNGTKEPQAGLKLHVQWDLLSGKVCGPILTDGKHADQRSPLRQGPAVIPEGGVYLCDNGYFGLQWLQEQASAGRYALTRPRATTAFFDQEGRRLNLLAIAPQAVGATLDVPVQVGVQVRWSGRLIMVRVPEDVAELRQERIKRTAQRHSREADPEHLALAHWTILITNVPVELLSTHEVVVMQRARWQIERLFRLWKELGLLDEWRSKNRDRIVCEIYGKLMGLLIEQWMLQLSCWADPRRSLFKASRLIRDYAWDLLRMVQRRLSLRSLLQEIATAMGSTCRIEQRQKFPSTAQLLSGWVPHP
jgi:Transposase DDE domain